MPFPRNSDARTKINALIASLPDDMDAERDQLHDAADAIYTMDDATIRRTLNPLIAAIKERAGKGGSSPVGFPHAGDARRSIFDLESAMEAFDIA